MAGVENGARDAVTAPVQFVAPTHDTHIEREVPYASSYDVYRSVYHPLELGGTCRVATTPRFLCLFFGGSTRSRSRVSGHPTPEKARKWLARLTEEPHVAGTPQEKKVADYVRDRLDDFGLETQVETYQVYLNYPKSVAAKLVQPEETELSLREDFLDEDKDSSSHGMFPGVSRL